MKRRNPIIDAVIGMAGNALLDYLDMQPKESESDYPEIGTIPVVKSTAKKEGAIISIIGAPTMGKTICSRRLAEIIGKPTYAISP